jgi:beta-glucosidase
MKMSDGPVGVRCFGNSTYYPSTSYPAGICTAASWDTILAEREGSMLGYDARARGIHFLLAPAVNIYRSPLCGRNFEYLGEDPFLASRMAVALIRGIQSRGVIATAKHLAANNQEWNRHQVTSDVDERTLREIYLPAFEASVKEAQVGAIMTSYNFINGIHASEHSWLNNDIVKQEWGFSGIMMSDWFGTYNVIGAANGGLDLEMPYGKHMNKESLLKAVSMGLVSEKTIDDKVRRILRTAMRFGFFDRPQTDPSASLFNQEGRQVALEMALGGMVLLKNERMLPLKKETLKSIAVIGHLAQELLPQGGGSSKVDPLVYSNFLSGIANAVDPSTKVLYCRGVPDLQKIASQTRLSITREGNIRGLFGEYFDNPDLKGKASLVRLDPAINFQWKENSYRPDGPKNHYSARWTGYYLPLSTGDFTFYISASNGFRVFVDDEKLIDNWHVGGDPTQRKTKFLKEGKPYKVVVEYSVGYGPQGIEFGITSGKHPCLVQASKTAKQADAVILCVGFGSAYEGEDWDRSFTLPLGQNELIRTVLAANKNVVVVVSSGGNIDMLPWIEATPALLYAWYPGEEGGKALAKILFGDVSPSGKLPVSFERKLEDGATYDSYYDRNDDKRVVYREGVFLGYRHFDNTPVKPLFPFGFGLSYTTFAYDNLQVIPLKDGTRGAEVTFTIKNTGNCTGAEIAQLYVRDTHSNIERPLKELKGFAKVELMPGEEKEMRLLLDERALSYFDTKEQQWTVEPGEFTILVGSSSASIHLAQQITIQ